MAQFSNQKTYLLHNTYSSSKGQKKKSESHTLWLKTFMSGTPQIWDVWTFCFISRSFLGQAGRKGKNNNNNKNNLLGLRISMCDDLWLLFPHIMYVCNYKYMDIYIIVHRTQIGFKYIN